MKTVTYKDGFGQAANLRDPAERATRELNELLGLSASQVSAEWDRTEDERGRPLVTLRIWDGTGEAIARFTPRELEDPTQLRGRFYHLWGDLLEIRSHKQLQALMEFKGS